MEVNYQDKQLKKYFLQDKGSIIISWILRETISNSKMNPQQKVEQKHVMAEMVTQKYDVYQEKTVRGIIRKFPVDVKKLKDLGSAEQHEWSSQRPSGHVLYHQNQLFEKVVPYYKDWRNYLSEKKRNKSSNKVFQQIETVKSIKKLQHIGSNLQRILEKNFRRSLFLVKWQASNRNAPKIEFNFA